MNQFDGEFEARKHVRKMDALKESPLVGRILDAVSDGGAAAAAIGAVVIPPAAPAFSVIGASFMGLGLFRRAWKFGKPSFEQMIEDVEAGADDQAQRILEQVHGQAECLEEFRARLQSQEAETARLSALFHGLRTCDPRKHRRLGRLTINCIFENDVKPESLDTMMRATVELREQDIRVLKSINEMQSDLFTTAEMAKPYGFRVDAIRRKWKTWWDHDGSTYLADGGAAFRGSTARLQSTGLIVSIGRASRSIGASLDDFELLLEGKTFYERLQEIAA